MAQQPMYPAVANSIITELAADVTNSSTTITVVNGASLPAGPNLITIGWDETAETVLYTAKSGNTLTGCTRGFGGTIARPWGTTSRVARYFTAADHESFRKNILDVAGEVETARTGAGPDYIGYDTLPERLEAERAEIISRIDAANAQLADIAINVKDFGATGDGVTDDTLTIQSAIEYARVNGKTKISIPDGTYMIKAHDPDTTEPRFLKDSGGIALYDNMTLTLSDNAVLKAIPNNIIAYQIVRVYNKTNVSILGGTFQGERNSHTGITGEFGYGISIHGGSNIKLQGVKCIDCWGDGINLQVVAISGVEYPITSFSMDSVLCDNNRRQGMSIEGLINGVITNSTFRNTGGTAPQAGVDIEPYSATNLAKNIRFSNCYFYDNAGPGFLIAGKAITGDNIENIVLENCSIYRNRDTTGANGLGSQIGTFNASNIQILGCNIEGYLTNRCIYINGGKNFIVANSILKNGEISVRAGNYMTTTYDVKFDNCILEVNRAANGDGMIFIDSSCHDVSINNVSINNISTGLSDTGRAIKVAGKRVKVTGGRFINNSRGIETEATAENCDFTGVNVEDCGLLSFLLRGSGHRVTRNVIAGSCWNNAGQPTMTLSGSSDNIQITGNTFILDPISGVDRGSIRSGRVVAYDASTNTSVVKENKIVGTYPLFASAGRPNTTNVVQEDGTIMSGTTAQRPTGSLLKTGFPYNDSTLSKTINYNGTAWKDAMGTTV